MWPKALTGFRLVGSALIFFIVADLAIFTLVSVHPRLFDAMVLTPEQPSGIVTAIFNHKDLVHLLGNLAAFVVLSAFFVGVNLSGEPEARRSASEVFVFGSFYIAVVVNIVQFRVTGLPNLGVTGASVMNYGATGILLASAFYNLPRYLGRVSSAWEDSWGQTSPSLFLGTSFSATTLALFFYFPVFQTEVFFYMSSGVAWFPHQIGFVLGLAVGFLMLLCGVFRKGDTGGTNDATFFQTDI